VAKAHLALSVRPAPRPSFRYAKKTLGHPTNVSAPLTISGSATSDIVAAVRNGARQTE